jgi:hypothetical protein
MPVTARLSHAFYERLGEQVTNELVDWFNAVDATYRADLRELNETNFARFDAKVEQRLAELRANLEMKIEQRLAETNTRMDTRFAESEIRMAKGFADVRSDMHSYKAELLKWMFLFWAGTALGGLLLR